MAANDTHLQASSTSSVEGSLRALQSAEFLLSSLLDHSSTDLEKSKDDPDGFVKAKSCDDIITGEASTDDLDVATGSLVGMGEKSLLPYQLSAMLSSTHRSELLSPRETLKSFAMPPNGYMEHESLEGRLTECERNLSVAAEMGLTLLTRNEMIEGEAARLHENISRAESRIAQLQHDLSVKDSLLEQYIQDAAATAQEPSLPSWTITLRQENTQLKAANKQLASDNARLQHEAQQMVNRSKVQQCLEQFTAAKEELHEVQSNMEEKGKEMLMLRIERDRLATDVERCRTTQHLTEEENEELRDQLASSHQAINQLLVEVQDLQDRNELLTATVEEAQEEIRVMKELTAINSSSSDPQFTYSSVGEHTESIVKEIEDALRKEIIAASTLPERPPSPNNYARQRTMVVMETVRAATLASARKLEQIARNDGSSQPEGDNVRSSSRGSSDGGSHVSLPGELTRCRQQQTYVSPQKLQIVKPMEGSVTLLRWKLLATPQLGGAASYFTSTDHPGVHQKLYSASYRGGSTAPSPVNMTRTDRKWKSVSDLSSTGLERSSRRAMARSATSRNKAQQHTASPSSSSHTSRRCANSPPPPSILSNLKQQLWGVLSPRSQRAHIPLITTTEENADDSDSKLSEV